MNFLKALFSAFTLGFGLGCTQSKALSEFDCTYQQELPSIQTASKLGAVFLFGESHGTEEAPDFVANFSCMIAETTEESTIVLLELAIPEVLSELSIETLPVAKSQNLILEGDGHWGYNEDGRTSAAMMDAILQILELRDQGLNIALGSIYPDDDILSKYDEMQLTFADEATFKNRFFLESLQISRYKESFNNVIVLSGKNHTRNHLQFFEKMDLDEPYMGFVLTSGGGTEWNCRSHGGGCKVHPTRVVRKTLVDSTDDASLVLFNNTDEVFDGAFVFKTTTASLPFFKNQQQQP